MIEEPINLSELETIMKGDAVNAMYSIGPQDVLTLASALREALAGFEEIAEIAETRPITHAKVSANLFLATLRARVDFGEGK